MRVTGKAHLVEHLDSYGVDIRWTNINTFTSNFTENEAPSAIKCAQQTIQTMLVQAMRRADLVTA